MATTERWDDIVALVSRRGFVTVGELSRVCDVSEVTVRRDLQALHDQGRLQRTYGGAAAPLTGAPDGQGSSEQQAEGFLAGRFDALIATPVSPTLERVLLDRAASRKVPIIAESLGMAGAQTVVAVDNYQAGHDLGRWAGDYVRLHFDGGATLLDLTHDLSNTRERSRGFLAGLREVVPDARLVLSIDAEARADTAYQLTLDALAVHPSINVIFAINDTTAAGAMAACRELGLAPAATLVVTFGLEGDTMKDALFTQDYCKAGLAMFPEIVGRVCIEAAIQSIGRRPLPAQLVTPHAVLTAASLAQFYEREEPVWRLNWQAVREHLTVPLPVDRTLAERAATPRSITFVVPFSEHEWYRSLVAAMHEHSARLGIELEVVDAAQSLRDEVELRKCAIAQRAAQLVRSGDVLIVDDGQVTTFLAEALREHGGITVITNSVGVFETLRHNSQITLISTGGLLRPGTQALIGPTAEAALADLRADKLFLATTGISLDFGLSHPDLAEVSAKQAMIRAAREVILLADHSKFEGDLVMQLAPIDAIDILVTDNALPASVRLELSTRGVEIILAET